MQAYNLFRRKGRAALCCAVPQDVVVPDFVTEQNWDFDGKIEAAGLTAFHWAAADICARFNGFYLFLRF